MYQTEPMISIVSPKDNWAEYTLRYVVDYKKKKDENYTFVLKNTNTNNEVKRWLLPYSSCVVNLRDLNNIKNNNDLFYSIPIQHFDINYLTY
jgi:hypothetical protein